MSDIVTLPPEDDTAEEAELRAQLERQDNETEREAAPDRMPELESEDADKSESQPDEVKDKQPDSSETEAEKSQRERDEKGRFKPKAEAKPEQAQPAQPEGQPEAQPQPSKDEVRLARNWQKLEQEKLEVRNTLAEIRQLKATLDQQLAQRPSSQPRFGSRDFQAAADEFERQAAALMRDGDVDQAQQKLQLARDSRAQAQQVAQQEQTEYQRTQTASFEREWQNHAEQAIQQHPELGDPNSEAAQAMMELLEEYPILGYVPDGFKKGVEILSLRRDAATVSGLRTENDKLKKELNELRKKTAITGGGLSARISSKSFDEMTLDEQEAYLERQARAEDMQHSS